METEKIIDWTNKKECVLLFNYSNQVIDLGKFDFTQDGSLIFTSPFHQDAELDFGHAKLTGEGFVHLPVGVEKKTTKDFHLSLHPPQANSDSRGIFHLRGNRGVIYLSQELDWFPVNLPFNLFYFFTSPLDQCKISKKHPKLNIQLEEDYNDSLCLKVDIFPRDTNEHVPATTHYLWGFSPHYRVRIGIFYPRQRLQSLLLFPENPFKAI